MRVLLSLAVLAISLPSSAATYYVDSSLGNDANSGTSSSAPWASLSKVNGSTFAPGDQILLVRGGTWNGQLHPCSATHCSGTSAQHIVISAYGNAASALPRIDANGIQTAPSTCTGGAINLVNQDYWEIHNVEVTNQIALSMDSHDGILVANCPAGGIRPGISPAAQSLNYINISNVFVHDVHGTLSSDPSRGYYGANAGIAVVAGENTNDPTCGGHGTVACNSTWKYVYIANNTVTTVNRVGIFVGPAWQDVSDLSGAWNSLPRTGAASGVTIQSNRISDSGGDGIVTFVTANTVIDSNVVANGGARATACPSPGASPYYCNGSAVGLWTVVTDVGTVQYNEVYGQTTSTGFDGEGYDADVDSTNVTFQFNYSHNNRRGMMLICDDPSVGAITNLKFRYNVSYSDATDAGVSVIRTDCGTGNFPGGADPADINNNTIYMAAGSSGRMIGNQSGSINNLAYIYNNIFYWVQTPPAWESMPQAVFDYNNYYSFSGFYSWPADAHAITAAPRFVNPSSVTTGRANTTGLQLLEGTPDASTGTNTGYLGTFDFWGNFIPTRFAPSIGAYNGTPVNANVNLALYATVSSSSSYEVAPWSMLNAVDGQLASINNTFGWTSYPNSAAPQWIEVDLPSPQTFDEIDLYPRTDAGNAGVGFPIDFQIQVWNGSTWLTRVSKTGYAQPTTGQAFRWGFADTTDKIRIYGTNLRRDSNNSLVMQFAEVEVYNR